MNLYDLKSFLELKVIWKDEHMFELRITASNGRFLGRTEVYETSDSLKSFAESLIGFPSNNTQTLSHKCGQKDSYAYFAMKFYCIDTAGHLGVLLNLESNVATEYRPEEKDKLSMEMKVEPSAIDNFQKALIQLAINQDGIAHLNGINN